ncbi:MAG: FkbM family methyltransferase [archaeon]
MSVRTDFHYMRSVADDDATKALLDELALEWDQVRHYGKVPAGEDILQLNMAGRKFFMKRKTATSTIDTFLEAFQHAHHMRITQFSGKDDQIVVDLGANEGYYLMAMKMTNPCLRIIAAEPVIETFEILKMNVEQNNLQNIELVNKAVTAKSGKIPFQIIPEVSVVNATDIAMQGREWLDNKRIHTIKVDSTTLPALFNKYKLKNIDILKLDVEGSELDILKSSAQILKHIRKIVVEYHSIALKEKCSAFLSQNWFQLVLDESEGKSCGDLYFINRKFEAQKPVVKQVKTEESAPKKKTKKKRRFYG